MQEIEFTTTIQLLYGCEYTCIITSELLRFSPFQFVKCLNYFGRLNLIPEISNIILISAIYKRKSTRFKYNTF